MAEKSDNKRKWQHLDGIFHFRIYCVYYDQKNPVSFRRRTSDTRADSVVEESPTGLKKNKAERKRVMAREQFQTLTEPMYYILMALSEECCGVDIMEKVRQISGKSEGWSGNAVYNAV